MNECANEVDWGAQPGLPERISAGVSYLTRLHRTHPMEGTTNSKPALEYGSNVSSRHPAWVPKYGPKISAGRSH